MEKTKLIKEIFYINLPIDCSCTGVIPLIKTVLKIIQYLYRTVPNLTFDQPK